MPLGANPEGGPEALAAVMRKESDPASGAALGGNSDVQN